jgi:hypothetical protein
VLAVNTAGIAAESTLWTAAGINAKTAQAYQSGFCEQLAGSNCSSRVTLTAWTWRC